MVVMRGMSRRAMGDQSVLGVFETHWTTLEAARSSPKCVVLEAGRWGGHQAEQHFHWQKIRPIAWRVK